MPPEGLDRLPSWKPSPTVIHFRSNWSRNSHFLHFTKAKHRRSHEPGLLQRPAAGRPSVAAGSSRPTRRQQQVVNASPRGRCIYRLLSCLGPSDGAATLVCLSVEFTLIKLERGNQAGASSFITSSGRKRDAAFRIIRHLHFRARPGRWEENRPMLQHLRLLKQ